MVASSLDRWKACGAKPSSRFLFLQRVTGIEKPKQMKPSSTAAVDSFTAKILLGIFFFSLSWHANPRFTNDAVASESIHTQSDDAAQAEGADFNLGAWFASSVWPHISAVDGDRCPSEPTCSSYSLKAFRKHGFFIGWAMTVDRLIHEADEGRMSPLVRRDGEFKIFDPVENNDYWWYGRDDRDRD
jgi:hypothetical protein